MGLDRNRTDLVYVAPREHWPAFASFSAISDVYYKLKSALGTSPTSGKVIAIWPAPITLLKDFGHSQTLFEVF